jgi:4-diphosphocytidyl-2-C-methyl-D-erythritol kinase
LWDVDADLTALAAQLGSDVAFPILGNTAVGTGRGEKLVAVPAGRPLSWVFALADFGISAGAAYGELDRQRATGAAPAPVGGPEELLGALASGDVARIAARLANDLQPAALALQPSLRATLDAGRHEGALAGIVSGSGPTCAFLCADTGAAEQLAERLAARGSCRAVRVASGPAPGAQVVA